MRREEIVSLRTALLFLVRGDSVAQRFRLACILAVGVVCLSVVVCSAIEVLAHAG